MKCTCDECGKEFILSESATGENVGTIETNVGGCASDPGGYTAAYCPYCGHEHVLRGH